MVYDHEAPTVEEICISLLRDGELEEAARLISELPCISGGLRDALATMLKSPSEVSLADRFFLPFRLVAVRWPTKGRPRRNVVDVCREQAIVRRVASLTKAGMSKTQAVNCVADNAGTKSGKLHVQTVWKLCKKYGRFWPK